PPVPNPCLPPSGWLGLRVCNVVLYVWGLGCVGCSWVALGVRAACLWGWGGWRSRRVGCVVGSWGLAAGLAGWWGWLTGAGRACVVGVVVSTGWVRLPGWLPPGVLY